MEKIILVAERDYRTIHDKLQFVNLKMKYIRWAEGEKEPVINYGCKKKIISQSVYYNRVGGMEAKAKIRAQHIIKNLLPELINEHDTLKEDRKELHDMMVDAQRAEKHMAAARLKLAQIETGRRIFALKQNIATLMERGHTDTEEATLGEQIRLLTTLH